MEMIQCRFWFKDVLERSYCGMYVGLLVDT